MRQLLFYFVAVLLSGAVNGAPVTFTDQTSAAGLQFTHTQSRDHQSGPMTGGGAVGDFNRDGYPDIFVIGGGSVADALFINNRDGTFTNRAEEWGVTRPHRGVGVTVADYDGDGDDDIYVTSFGPMDVVAGPGHHILYKNNGNHFTNVAAVAGVATSTADYPDGYGAAFGDYDRDGDLDLFVGGWHDVPALGARLFSNNGDGTFSDTTLPAGIIAGGTHAFGAVWADMDGDRYPELLVAGDFGTNRYYRNNRNGTFTELDPGTGQIAGSDDWTIGKAHNGMGTAVADFNGDGRPDWFVTAIWPTFAFASEFWGNGLYINNGQHVFSESAESVGVHDGGWGWGAEAVDIDNDGRTDLLMTNGWTIGDTVTGANFTDDRSRVWLNQGADGFADISAASGFDEHTGQGRALLTLDYDRDGDLDVVILANQAAMQLFRNDLIDGATARDARWLQVRLDTSANPRLTAHGAGVTITVEAGGKRQTRQIAAGGNYLGQSELVAHFGLGRARMIRKLTVDWGNGKKTRLKRIKPNRRITIRSRCRPSVGPKNNAICSRPGQIIRSR